jgi:L-asparaginase II
MQIPDHAPLVATTRGGHVECVHYGSIAVVDRDGRLVAGAGDPGAVNFTRSALKPFQALPFVEDDGVAHFGFDTAELALMCASHSGEAMHVATAQRILGRIGARETDLQCGCHVPYWYQATDTRPPADRQFGPLFHNCSGKHSGFLAYCRLHRKPLSDYLDPDSSVQARIAKTVRGFAAGGAIPMGIDGCSAPNYALPLTRLAQMYCRLALGETPPLAALSFAMKRHPDLVSGTARFDLALMQAGAPDWIGKAGADGVQAVGVTSKGLGIAVRICDGNPRALHAATVEVLQQLGLLGDAAATPLARFARPPIRSLRGVEVGRVEPVFRLTRSAA